MICLCEADHWVCVTDCVWFAGGWVFHRRLHVVGLVALWVKLNVSSSGVTLVGVPVFQVVSRTPDDVALGWKL